MSEARYRAEILDGLKEIQAHKQGRLKLRTTRLSEPSMPQTIRAKLALTQSAFAGLLGVSLRTLQDWEQGRRRPQGPAVSCAYSRTAPGRVCEF